MALYLSRRVTRDTLMLYGMSVSHTYVPGTSVPPRPRNLAQIAEIDSLFFRVERARFESIFIYVTFCGILPSSLIVLKLFEKLSSSTNDQITIDRPRALIEQQMSLFVFVFLFFCSADYVAPTPFCEEHMRADVITWHEWICLACTKNDRFTRVSRTNCS